MSTPYEQAVEAAVAALGGPRMVVNDTGSQRKRDVEEAVGAALPHLLAPIEALHRPRDVQAITARDCVHEVCGHEDACPTNQVTTCAHCWDIAERVDAYLAERGIPEEVLWPCATAAALASIKGQPS